MQCTAALPSCHQANCVERQDATKLTGVGWSGGCRGVLHFPAPGWGWRGRVLTLLWDLPGHWGWALPVCGMIPSWLPTSLFYQHRVDL